MHPASSLDFKFHKEACCEITLVEKVMSANSADGGTASKAASKPLFTSSRKSAPHVRSTNAIYIGCPGTCPGQLSLAACIPCAVYLQAHVQTASRCSVRLTVLCRQLPSCWVVTCPTNVKLSPCCQMQVCQIDQQDLEGLACCECIAANCFMVPALRCYQPNQLLSCKAFQLHLAAALEPVGVPCPEPDKDKGTLQAKAGVAGFHGNFEAPAEMSAGQHNCSKRPEM